MLDPDIINQLTKSTPLARKIKRLAEALRANPTTPQFTRQTFGGSLPNRVKISERLDPMKTPVFENDKNLTNGEHDTCKNSQGENSPETPGENAGENADFHPGPVAASLPANSTIPSKLPPDTLAALHDALTSPERATYAALYERFNLREKNIGFTAFYNYCRPIRLGEACESQATLGRSLIPDKNKMFPDLIATRLLAALVDETVTPRQINQLVDAYRMALNFDLTQRRLEKEESDKLRKAKSRELEDLARTVKEYTRAVRMERAASKPQRPEADDGNE